MYFKFMWLVLALLAWLLWSGLHAPIPGVLGVSVDKAVPEFQLESLTSSQTLTRASLPNTRFLLNVWASWCAACRAEHAYLESLAETGIDIVGINYRDDPTRALHWLERYEDPYLFHINDEHAQLALDLGVTGAPESFVIDEHGIIRHHHIGVLNERVFSSWRNWLVETPDTQTIDESL